MKLNWDFLDEDDYWDYGVNPLRDLSVTLYRSNPYNPITSQMRCKISEVLSFLILQIRMREIPQ